MWCLAIGMGTSARPVGVRPDSIGETIHSLYKGGTYSYHKSKISVFRLLDVLSIRWQIQQISEVILQKNINIIFHCCNTDALSLH